MVYVDNRGGSKAEFKRVIGFINEMITCQYISIGDAVLSFFTAVPQPI